MTTLGSISSRALKSATRRLKLGEMVYVTTIGVNVMFQTPAPELGTGL